MSGCDSNAENFHLEGYPFPKFGQRLTCLFLVALRAERFWYFLELVIPLACLLVVL